MTLTNKELCSASEAIKGLCALLNADLSGKVTVDTVTCELGGELGHNYTYSIIGFDGAKWVPGCYPSLTHEDVLHAYSQAKFQEVQFVTLTIEGRFPF